MGEIQSYKWNCSIRRNDKGSSILKGLRRLIFKILCGGQKLRLFKKHRSNVPRRFRLHLSAEEEIAAEESLSIYCKPVEVYNILQRRAVRNGLRHHLPASHDLFSFEFWVTEEYQAVNVSVKTDSWRSEIVADGIDPKQQTSFSWHAHPVFMESKLLAGGCELPDKAHGGNILQNARIGAVEFAQHRLSSSNVDGVSGAAGQSYSDSERIQPVSGNNLAPCLGAICEDEKNAMERSDPRKSNGFFTHIEHSCLWRADETEWGLDLVFPFCRPMAIDQVMSDRDSECEVDDVVDIEDRRMLDDFVDVTKDEKQIMHLWNSFVRKQRVLADGHIPWACEAFSKLHGRDLVKAPALFWCWRLFMIKLWNHGILDARTMNNCNIVLEQYQKQDLHPVEG
ncbi:hypothetical protein V6N13_074128 [Hibiscus sabdariffa]|uniref:Uncharacterized protein n=1 Tax=Hibiscus sabdariffa TaxID=183260 RepID=A0ABR2U867_9ROSI